MIRLNKTVTMFCWFVFIVTVAVLFHPSSSQVLNPPYFNIAENRRIHATMTCGENTLQNETFCKIIGSMWTENFDSSQERNSVVGGHACDYCNATDPKHAHPAEYAIDGSPKWWQSPPLSRGPEAAKVNLTIDLGQEFHVAYVYITMGNSPRPGVWVLERSTDNGETFKPWMYFADSREECTKQFGEESVRPLTRDDQVICETKYSKLLPLENGEMVVSLIEKRPSGDNFASSETLQNFTKATNVRLRFIRPQTTFGQLLNVDQTATRRYFYSIREINIGGRCVCNGHAETCDVVSANEPDQLNCACQHNTDGDQCERCKPPYLAKRWRASTPDKPFVCEPCNCNGHSNECEFDEEVEKQAISMDIHGNYAGGGRCMHCKHQTTGVNCHECQFGFYRPEGRLLNATDVCVKCNCRSKFSYTGGCDVGTGQCQCKSNFTNAPACDECAYGYYNPPYCPRCPCYRNGTLGDVCDPEDGRCICKDPYSGSDCSVCADTYWGVPDRHGALTCKECNCDQAGSLSLNCNNTNGQCSCKKQFSGSQCSSCSIGFYNYPECASCNCHPNGTTEEICDQSSGRCKCRPGFGGEKCDQCEPGYFNFPECKTCACDPTGSVNQTCNKDGRCVCATRFGGLKCNLCAVGYFNFPKCESCGCDIAGSIGVTCQNGVCQCRENFDGNKCNKCKKNYYGYPNCESCSCNPAGVMPNFLGCSEIMSGKMCECKERVTGRYCDTCSPGFKNLRPSNPSGCEPCRCNRAGSLNSLDYCDGETGQCVCKESVRGLACDVCEPGNYALSAGNFLGCAPCDCDVGGSYRAACDQRTGQCSCKYRIEGRRCDRPQKVHYFYTTYQYLYEMEDGRGEHHSVRYDYNETDFPGFSWKGYAKFEKIQRKVMIDFVIIRSSFYRVIFNYHNPGDQPIEANLTLSNENEPPQHIKVTFPPTTTPKRYLVPMDKSSPLYLFAAQRPWKATLTGDQPLLVDYIVFLPQAYFEATILKKNVTEACTISTANYQLCQHYGYTKFPTTAVTYPKDLSIVNGNADVPADTRDSFLIDATLLSDQEREHVFDLEADESQKYFLILSYVYRVASPPPKGQIAKLTVQVNTLNGTVKVPFQVPMCQYTFPCRYIVVNDKAAPVDFHLESGTQSVSVELNNDIGEATFGILGLVFLPKQDWHIDHVKPSLVCIMRNLTCLDMSYDPNPESTKISFGARGQIYPMSTNSIEGSSDIQERTVDLVGTAPRTEHYQMIVHYYQPDHPSFEMELTFQRTPSSPSEQATLAIAHCASKSGCRSVIKFKKPLGVLEEGKEFTLVFIPPKNRGVHFDFLLLTAEKSFTPALLQLPVVDRSTEFLRNCAQDAFYIDDKSSEFCKQALFSLTTVHNGGGTYCSCNATGSLGYTCNPLGGQCECKPNVIGRECKACRSGYWGFPNCERCNCSKTAAYCEPVNGDCVCPKNVVGPECDGCAPRTYGYDPKMGCEECNCHPAGVKDGNLQCNDTGHCDCQSKYEGRTCDSCKQGYWDFPVCRVCDCHVDGTTIDICDSKTATCYCKENTLRPNCDVCRRGTYNLEKNNPQGCTKCFCFGAIENCRSSDLRIAPMRATNYSNWSAVGITFNENVMNTRTIDSESSSTENEFTIIPISNDRGDSSDVAPGSESQSNIYFKVSNEFLGNRITSYGGFIRYEILEIPVGSSSSDATPVTADIILVGRNYTMVLSRDEQPESPGFPYKVEVELLETNFAHLADEGPVSRPQLMTLLVDLQSIYIRASYFEPIQGHKISNFQIDSVSDKGDGPLALRVEQCICPPNYKGSSCEACANGYYRVSAGPYLGTCVACDCNNHSNECDPLTGKCFNCQHETTGEHCELCKAGFYGNATRGTPYDCAMCPCPSPNNFADSCEARPNARQQIEFFCDCKPGYTGQSCEICAAGHFGYPLVPGNYCQPCQCNGNVDPTDPLSCNLYSGECTKCLNNTAGRSCEYCANDYYGDAINLKSCQPCECKKCGTSMCDRYSGKCECHPNVIGENCDQCRPNHYGFNKCLGCKPCNCSDASVGKDCDMESGQCKCQPGVTGRTCDKCEVGYWKFSNTGCTSCGCIEKYSRGVVCNQQTGLCECLPGVLGEKCDKCPWRWVFVDREGCLECGECQHALLNDTDALDRDLFPVFNEFSNSSSGIHAKKKYATLSNEVTLANQRLTQLTDLSQSIDLKPLEESVQKVLNESEASPLFQERLTRLAAGVVTKVIETKENATAVRRHIKKVNADLGTLLQQLKNVDFETIVSVDELTLSKMLEVASFLFDATKQKEFKRAIEEAVNETSAVDAVLKRVQEYVVPYVDEKKKLNESKTQLDRLESVLGDANKNIISSITTALNVQRKINISRESFNEVHIPRTVALKNLDQAISDNLKEAKSKINSSGPIIDSTTGSIDNLVEISNQIAAKKSTLSDRMFKPEDLQDSGLLAKVNEAVDHSYALNDTAIELDSVFLEAFRRSDLSRTMRAATAYEVIEKAIDSSERIINEVNDKMDSNIWKGIQGKIQLARSASSGNRTEARDLKAAILENGSKKLAQYNETIKSKGLICEEQKSQLEKIDKDLESIQVSSTGDLSREVLTTADAGIDQANQVSERVDALLVEFNQLSNSTKQLSEEDKTSFIDIQESKTMTSLYGEKGIGQKIRNATAKVERMVELIESSKAKFKQLQENVIKARDQANRIDVAVKFTPGSFIQLRKPQDLESSGSYTKISLNFNASRPNGLLAYVGNPQRVSGRNIRATSDTTDDYMAILLKDGKIQVVLDLGSGPQTLSTDTRVDDGTWTHLIVERIGKTLKITINRDNRELVTHGHVQGFSSVLDLNTKRTRIFVGSIPENQYVIPDTIKVGSFVGSVAFINLGDTPLGLLNFQQGSNVMGDFLPSQLQTKGMHFNGRGWASYSIDTEKLSRSTPITITVRTYARSGLILLLTGPNDFLAIQLDDGRPMAIIDLGSGYVSITSPDRINDGNEHTIQFSREFKEIWLGVRDKEMVKAQTSGSQTTLDLDKTLYIGGYSGKHNLPEVTSVPYEGCFVELEIDAKFINLNNSTMAPGVTAGCPDSNVREAVFEPGYPGYIEMPLSIEIIDSVQVSFKFRTNVSNGLLFFAPNIEEPAASFLAVYLSEGTLSFTTHPGRTIKSSGILFDDNEWHYVMVSKNPGQLRMDIDDKTEVDLDLTDTFNLNIPSGSFYLGGAPNKFTATLQNYNILDKFTGCIGDAVVHDKFQDLKKATNVIGATLVTCKIISDGKPRPTTVPEALSPPETISVSPSLTSTTTTLRTTERPPEACNLPHKPFDPTSAVSISGRRFGGSRYSRAELKLSQAIKTSLETESTVSLEFRTVDEKPSGVIFFLADAQYVDIFVLYMKQGILHFAWNTGSGLRTISEPEKNKFMVNGVWYNVTFGHKAKLGRIIYHNGEKTEGESGGNFHMLNVEPTAYVGGMPKQAADRIRNLLQNITTSFPGCIRNVVISGVKLSLEDNGRDVGHNFINPAPCYNKIEKGAFFDGNNSYISCMDKFRVGTNVELLLDIKPRTETSLLLASFGPFNETEKKITDYLIAKMVNGSVIVTVDNGKGPADSFIAIEDPNSNTDFKKICDGTWHRIKIWKFQNAHFVQIDDEGNSAVFTTAGVNTADTTSPLFIGDVPQYYREQFPDLPPPYIGCVNNIEFLRPIKGSTNKIDLLEDCDHFGSAYNYCPAI